MKKVAMIPVLLGSTRIPDKNLLLVDGKPMVFYVAEACKQSGIFDEIYINSEHDIFRGIAEMLGVAFYRRMPERGGSLCTMQSKSRHCLGDRCQTHDHFLFDFMQSREPCYLALAHTTSPLIQSETIRVFMERLIQDNYDSLFSVEERYTETLFGENPLNFSMSEKIPTQTLPPIRLITWALSGWQTASFMESYLRDDPKEKGPTFCSKVGYFPLNRIEALDGDTWEDYQLIEASLNYRRQKIVPAKFRFSERITSIESNLKELIEKDGVIKYEDGSANRTFTTIEGIKEKMGEAPWLYLLAYTSADQTALICQNPGEGARKHCHVTHDEWWIVLEGSCEWHLDNKEVIRAEKGNVIFLPKGTIHSIISTGDKPSIRLACGARDMEHIYYRD